MKHDLSRRQIAPIYTIEQCMDTRLCKQKKVTDAQHIKFRKK